MSAPAAAVAALLALAAVASAITITEFAVPKAIPLGGSAELQCRYSLEAGEAEGQVVLKWWWRGEGQDAPLVIYQRIGGNAPSVVHRNIEARGNDSLLLVGLQAGDAGHYECEVAAAIDEDRQRQALAVYTEGSGPHVNVTEAEEDVENEEEQSERSERGTVATCEASEVAPRPDLVISLDGVVLNSTQEVFDLPGGLYNVTARAPLAAPRGAGALRCELFYEDAALPHPAYLDVMLLEPAAGEETTTESAAPAPGDSATDAEELREPDAESGADATGGSAMLLTLLALLYLV